MSSCRLQFLQGLAPRNNVLGKGGHGGGCMSFCFPPAFLVPFSEDYEHMMTAAQHNAENIKK